ncbi:hypothetical protein M0805_003992 [Coniferiporia weirii]|nr:hypothetical protein M0805_003992 [Coniferiporia weirii]
MSDAHLLDVVDGLTGRPMKEPATEDLPFFTPASMTFNPKPYFPHSSHSINHGNVAAQATSSHEVPAAAPPAKSLDVALDDPDATFIHYPDSVFPDSHLHPEGLTYKVLADNPDWFLVPSDFKTENDTRSDTAAYPQALEPPRGWCPAKKRDVKEKGPEAYEGSEAPKLRCTFCRRGYAGVNAKSMWRRHVLEKHKIPMSNRRDGLTEGGRGTRLSNKENKRASSSTPVDQNHSEPNEKPSVLLPVLGIAKESRSTRSSNIKLRPLLPSNASSVASPIQSDVDHSDYIACPRPSEPEFSFDDVKSSSAQHSPRSFGHMLPPSSPLAEGNSQASRVLPSSPNRTPGFKFTMPWKFPSPSHPLHSSPEELCLAVPISGIAGEGLRASYVALQASPFPGSASPVPAQFSSPIANPSPLSSKLVTGRVLGWKRSKHASRSKLPPLPAPSPLRPRYSGPLPAPATDQSELGPPDLTMSTDNELDSSFSSLGDPFSSWFELSSPGKAMMYTGLTDFPDTPIRRSVNGSVLDKLQLVDAESRDGTPSSTRLPSGVGLGFNFKFDLMASANKRPRSEDSYDANSLDGLSDAAMLPSPERSPSSQQSHEDRRSIDGSFPSVSRELGDSDVPPADIDSDDQASPSEELPPLRKRRKTY